MVGHETIGMNRELSVGGAGPKYLQAIDDEIRVAKNWLAVATADCDEVETFAGVVCLREADGLAAKGHERDRIVGSPTLATKKDATL